MFVSFPFRYFPYFFRGTIFMYQYFIGQYIIVTLLPSHSCQSLIFCSIYVITSFVLYQTITQLYNVCFSSARLNFKAICRFSDSHDVISHFHTLDIFLIELNFFSFNIFHFFLLFSPPKNLRKIRIK